MALPGSWRADGELFDVEDAAGDQRALVRGEERGGPGDVERRQDAAERAGLPRVLDPGRRLAFLLALDAVLALGERPTDVELVDADVVCRERLRGVARQRHQR